MMLPLLILLSASTGISAEEAFTVPQPLSPYGALNPSSGAAVIHINGAHEAKRTIYQPSASDSLVKHYPALDLIDIPLTFSGDDEKFNLPSSVLLPSLHHKKTYVPKGQGVAFQPHEPVLPVGNYLQKAPMWVPHAPTHSKHKFTIQNLGQSEKIISQFNKGSNGGKPYEIPRGVKSSGKDSLENEASKIADRIIKQELNRAKVAKFGKSGGGSYQRVAKNCDVKTAVSPSALKVLRVLRMFSHQSDCGRVSEALAKSGW
ncbi:unnamed protein product [Heligmosomoides polygyrus]|uniref:Secreted protein n=1 Tax=Heligmosomoides polygyrus TaxID=6339 RepID=A0A183G4C6_HELPZ|nr:unnamed protein product [Heligmosomoides polygyrus]